MKNYNRALIIDADPDLCTLLKSELSPVIPDIECACDKGTARELFNRLHPDIVFIDSNWPDAQWVELIKLIRNGSSPLIVFLTAVAKAIGGRAMEYRTEEFLEKSIANALELSREKIRVQSGTGRWTGIRLGGRLRRYLTQFLVIAKGYGF